MDQTMSLGTAQWLHAWEACAGLTSPHVALRLLQTACPDAAVERLAALTPGRRDSLLLDLREALFGRALACTTDCPICRQRLEFASDLDAMRVAADPSDAPSLRVVHEGFDVRFRMPSAIGIARVAHHADIAAARLGLLGECVIDARRDDETVDVRELPESVVVCIGAAMAAADPQGGTTVAMHCAGCGHDWEAAFDIAAFLWRELDGWARRLLLDVHALASRYGWTEPDVLALSPQRRQTYLDMAVA